VSDIVLNANAVGDVVTYVAPGFLAYTGFHLRYPRPESSSGHVLVLSVVLSLPLVAAAHAALGGAHKPTNLGYVLALLVCSALIGYLVALLRGWGRVQDLLGLLGYKLLPDGSTYSQTLARMSRDGLVQIELKDGRRILGLPRIGPQHQEDGINELYLVKPEVPNSQGDWEAIPGVAGMLVPLSEVSNITLNEDPTGAYKLPLSPPAVPQ
jgi:Family of unknown function (DUF6338)